MSRTSLRLLVPLLLVPLAAPVAADGHEAACRAKAERLSGHRPSPLEGQVGRLKFRLSGSLALGVSRSSGPPSPAPPPFAGEAHRERAEAARTRERVQTYQRIYDACMRDAEE